MGEEMKLYYHAEVPEVLYFADFGDDEVSIYAAEVMGGEYVPGQASGPMPRETFEKLYLPATEDHPVVELRERTKRYCERLAPRRTRRTA